MIYFKKNENVKRALSLPLSHDRTAESSVFEEYTVTVVGSSIALMTWHG